MGNSLEKPVKLLFLDVDGVLNSQASRQRVSEREGSKAAQTGLPPAASDAGQKWDAPDPAMCARLAGIVKRTGARVILSSTWRLEAHKLAQITRCLAEHGVAVSGSTPNYEDRLRDNSRPDEIAAFVDDYVEAKAPSVVGAWVAIDDLPLHRMDVELRDGRRIRGARVTEDHFVKTSDAVGLTDELAEEAVAKLGVLPEAGV
eukprot:g3504.t1